MGRQRRQRGLQAAWVCHQWSVNFSAQIRLGHHWPQNMYFVQQQTTSYEMGKRMSLLLFEINLADGFCRQLTSGRSREPTQAHWKSSNEHTYYAMQNHAAAPLNITCI